MKVLTITFTFLLFTIFSNAQMIVDDNGHVGIGPDFENATTVGSSEFALDGQAEFYGSGHGFKITFNSAGAICHPTTNYTSYLGTNTTKFDRLYAKNIYYTTLHQNSDIKIKENITDLESTLSKVMQIRTIKYDLKPSYFEGAPEQKLSELINEGKNKIGVVAQELQEVFPHLVKYDQEDDLHSVNYTGLIPVLVKAMQEQQLVINELQSQLDILEVGK